jgi:hypothetical protein
MSEKDEDILKNLKNVEQPAKNISQNDEKG